MNDNYGFTTTTNRLDFYYFWDQFQPIIAAVVILLLGWIIALAVAGGIKKILTKIKLNDRFNQSARSVDHHDLETISSRIIFWFILVIAVIASLNVLNLTAVSAPFADMVSRVLSFIPNLIAAIAIGIVGWLIATFVRTGLTRVLTSTELDEKLSQEVGVTPISHNIAEIVYWLILLLFLPMVLSILGLTGLLLPVQGMLTEAIAFLPNLFIAGVIVFAGYILAKIVRGIVEGLSNSFGLQIHAEKLGVFQSTNVSKLLGSFVFAMVMITSLIVAFDALGVEAISQPATSMLNQIMSAIPNILGAAIILIIAYVVARFVGKLVSELLAGTGVDEIPQKLSLQRFLGEQKISGLIGFLIVFFTMLFAVSEAANRVELTQVSELISMFIYFGANVLLGAVILVIGFWLANTVADVVKRGETQSSVWLANLVRILIMGLVIAMGLRAMGIADSIVNLAFGLTLGGVAVAFALAFGLGGREPAQRLLTKLIDKAEAEADLPNQNVSTSSSTVDLPKGLSNLNLHPETKQTQLDSAEKSEQDKPKSPFYPKPEDLE